MDKIIHSDFWLDDVNISNVDESYTSFDIDLIKMATAKKAVSNFVRILTNKPIPVLFNTQGANMTDGETVYLSSKIKEKKDFDVTVGLALHEGAHIVLSDFNLIKTLWQRTPRILFTLGDEKGMCKNEVIDLAKTTLNYIEDRFIDQYIFTTAPGYKGYYISLYERYFNSPLTTLVLQSQAYRIPTVDAYLFRMINFTNDGTDLTALPELETIFNLINYDDILRLDTPLKRYELSFEVTELILRNIQDVNTPPPSSGKKPGNSPGNKPSSSTTGGDSSSDEEPENDDSDEGKPESGNPDDFNEPKKSETDSKPDSSDKPENTESSKNELDDVLGGSQVDTKVDNDDESHRMGDTSEFTDVRVKKIEKLLETQKTFINGDVQKKSLTDIESNLIRNIEQSGMVLIRVGQNSSFSKTGVDCIVVNNLTNELLESVDFPLRAYCENPLLEEAVTNGIIMGKLLGKRLQIRNDVNVVKFMRKAVGKIDKRTIAELGFDNEKVFYTNQVDQYNNSFLHISVDASSSMGGQKWFKTMTMLVALCKAGSMINNLRISVSFRTTISSNTNGQTPYIVMAYDSSKDKFKKVQEFFKRIMPSNITPEGLTFEAIVDNLPNKKTDENFYFLNLSDGEPYFTGQAGGKQITYVGEPAAEHTKEQVRKIRNKGYKVISYFIDGEGSTSRECATLFKTMYGRDASFINVGNVAEIAKTMNALFLQKNNFD